MKNFIVFITGLIITSCGGSEPTTENKSPFPDSTFQVRPDFGSILDSLEVTGAILIYDQNSNSWYSNDFNRSNQGFLPASTFKIPNSIIGLETGVVDYDTSIFQWDGKKRRLKTWEKDMKLQEAFHASCVPCYQEIARRTGAKRMRAFLDAIRYGNMVFDSTTIDLFWLEGNSKISAVQQIEFLKRFYNEQLPVSGKTYATMKKMMIIEENNIYRLSGKTGWAIRNDNNYGWFVGYIEKNNNVYYFATSIEPRESFNMNLFPEIRNEITMTAMKRIVSLE